MTTTQVLVAAAAALVAAWPLVKNAIVWLAARRPLPLPPAAAAIKPTYSDAINDLQSVRSRLLRTGCLAQDQKNAIDVLTLALVDGSDQ